MLIAAANDAAAYADLFDDKPEFVIVVPNDDDAFDAAVDVARRLIRCPDDYDPSTGEMRDGPEYRIEQPDADTIVIGCYNGSVAFKLVAEF